VKIGRKLFLWFGTAAILPVLVAYFAIRVTNTSDNRFEELSKETIPTIRALEDLRFGGLRIVSSTAEFAWVRAESKAGERGGAGEEERLIESGRESYKDALKRYEDLVSKFFYLEDFQKEQQLLEDIRKTGQKLQEASAELIGLKIRGASGIEVLEKNNALHEAEHGFLRAVDSALAHEGEEFAERDRKVQASIATAVKTIVTVTAFAFGIAILLGIFVSRSISNPLRELRDAAFKIKGDGFNTRVEIRSKDEVGELARAFNEMAEDLGKSRRELLEAQERLVRTERLAAIGELSAGIAHELRNPLGAIKNATYYIKGKLRGSELLRDNPRVGEFLEILDEEIESSNQIITDLMDFARVNPPNLSPTRLETVIEEALSRTEVKRNIKVVKELEPGLPEVQVDPEKLRRSFGNLIKNADEAMPEGGTLTINARTADRSVEVQFRDTGQGISDPNLPKVFDPLFTTKPRGIGLGTAIVKKIIESHKGSINVSSKSGEGTNFTVRLPLSQD
jgi:signal transduction histidine kinase